MGTRQPKEKTNLAFFKVYLPSSANRIKIPSAYVTYRKGKISRKVSLRHEDGKVWPVKVEKIENDFFFIDGWAKYVEDNSLELGDFLVFQYESSKCYGVKLLGKSGCEKNAMEAIKEEQEEEEINNVQEEMEDHEEVQVTNEIEEADQENSGDSESKMAETNEDSEYIQEEEVEKVRKGKFRKRAAVEHAKSSQKDLKKSKGDKPVGHGEAEAVKDKRKSSRPDPYGDDIFKSGLVSRPQNPYFITTIRRKRRDELYVPSDFIQDHNLSLPTKITLQDQHGRNWSSKLTPWKDGRLWYYGGWSRLCRINMVGENDTCICELKKLSDGVHFIQVHIVREETMLKIRRNNN